MRMSSRSSVLPGALAHDDALQRFALVLDHGRRRHPVLRLEATGVGVDEKRPVRLDHQQPHRLGQDGVQPPGIDDLAAGDDQAHGVNVPSAADMSQRSRESGRRRRTPSAALDARAADDRLASVTEAHSALPLPS